METLRDLITEEMNRRGETWKDVEESTLTDAEMDHAFDSDRGTASAIPFYLWTANFVYFAYTIYGADSVESVPRCPSAKYGDPVRLGCE